MELSIVTPSFGMLSYLKRCHASVADQESVDVEHLVMDGGSRDGTAEWLQTTPSVHGASEPDRGMYDAINKGLRRARGEVLGYINCDEQYLPGALASVKAYFDQHPSVDVVVGDTLLIRPDGSLISFRKTYPLPYPLAKASSLHFHSCSLFFRRKVIEAGHYFDEQWRDIGDAVFVVRLMEHGYKFGYMRRYLSAFTMTGANMGAGPNVRREAAEFNREKPRWMLQLRPAIQWARRGIKLAHGGYFERMPLVYAVYPSEDARRRSTFFAERASFRWRTS